MTDKAKHNTAHHEAGHALVALLNGKRIVKATMMPRGGALGFVDFQHMDEHQMTKDQYIANLDTAFGGRIAEEVMYGADKVSSGASSDLQKATQIAFSMVTKMGFSKKGLLYTVGDSNDYYATVSPEMKAVIDTEVNQILEVKNRKEMSLIFNN